MAAMNVRGLAPGKKRQWVKCNKCGKPAYYDFTPYSLSTPLMTMPCGHGLGIDDATRVTADDALILVAQDK